MILDEGHKIKNPTKTTKGVHAIPAHNRIILTGTPVQNNLKVTVTGNLIFVKKKKNCQIFDFQRL